MLSNDSNCDKDKAPRIAIRKNKTRKQCSFDNRKCHSIKFEDYYEVNHIPVNEFTVIRVARHAITEQRNGNKNGKST